VQQIFDKLSAWLADLPPIAVDTVGLAGLLVVGLLADFAIRQTVVRLATRAAKRTRQSWDDRIIEYRVLHRLVHIVPALVVYFGVRLLPGFGDQAVRVISNLCMAYLTLLIAMTIGALLSVGNAIYSTYPVSKDRPIKGYVQVAKIVIYAVGGIVMISILLNRSPAALLTGFGAMTAVLSLIFRDTILSLVASIQMSSLDMIRVGDWIEVPQYNADGDVIDIALHTIKVQNWDKTITSIPTHKLISESFKNWRGMKDTGGRRIKRSINVDVNTVRFLTDDEIERFKSFRLLHDYIEERQVQLAGYNARLGDTANVNLRRLTNLGTFRAYLRSYLAGHPRIRQDMTLMVRQLQPGETGMPIEIYCFTNTTAWTEYETIQADLFDHILAQCHEFGLRVFQSPSGEDLRSIANG